ncbi:MAG: EAL domain-containing protein [Proteobacteria bacterium]|nr:EAL domain-containing protein [Pseudomonadota bacterium]
MLKQDDTQQAAELRLAFVRHLPKRLETLRKRGLRLCTQGWDINALSILFREVQTLAGTCGRYGLLDAGERLFTMESFLAPFVRDVAIPDAAQTEAFTTQLSGIDALIARHAENHIDAAVTQAAQLTVAPARAGSYPLQVTPPPEYWKRFAPTAAPARPSPPSPTPIATPPTPAVAAVPTPVPKPPAAAAVATPATVIEPAEGTAAPAAAEQRKVFHLSDGNPLACEVDQKIEAAGHELTLLDRIDELKEMLSVFAPHLVVVDAPFLDALEAIGEMIKAVRTRVGHRVALLAFSASPELPVRLRAMRAGADSFIALPAQSGEAMGRIAELLDADTRDPFRVLIVEDDRSQALFAESILRKAGMHTLAATDPLAALDQLEEFKPELILMDLYMPNCSGMELTAIIREREAFINTPIVFLSGEHDEEKHFEALNAGGDDFLSKPIRPKHLISAVTNRVRRARTQGRRTLAANPRDAVTGLYQRAHVLDRLNAALAGEAADGGLIYIELDGAGRIRERVGLTSFDALLNQIGAFLAAHIGAQDLAARYGDTSFVLLCQRDPAALAELATDLRDRTTREVFEHEGKSLALALRFGLCTFADGLGDASAMLNAAERALVDARSQDRSHIGIYRAAPRTAAPGADPLADLIRAALKAEDFQLLFQPMVALQGGEEEQFQALLRLRGDGGKLHTAAEILPVAEREGLAADIDRWVVSRCLLVMAERARQQRPVRLFAGQSIEAARDPERAAWIGQMLETRRLPGAQLVLEFRLPEAFANVRELTAFAATLRGFDIGLSLSAFDANPSSLQFLQHLPANYLKLSPRYSGSALREPALREELRQIVTRGHAAGARVIAPLIEDAQTASLLWTTGVDYLQGDFIQQAGQDLSFDFHAATA